MASRLATFLKNIFGKTLYSNIWIATSLGLISQVIGFTKYDGYFDLSTLSMGDSVGFAILNTSSQTINSTLKVGFIFNNSAII